MPTPETNRENAQHSTGPRTAAGKARTRFNACRHGLTGKTVVLPEQDMEAYRAFSKKLLAELHPESTVEAVFAQTVVDCSWRLNSAAVHELNLLAQAADAGDSPTPASDESIGAALTGAALLRTDHRVLNNISLYCQRLERQREKAFHQLQTLQKERLAARKQALEEAAALRKLCLAKQMPFDPAEFGLVFSIPELDAYIRREELLQEAWAFRSGLIGPSQSPAKRAAA